jgi:endonuclease YncB( thermonuclease family)
MSLSEAEFNKTEHMPLNDTLNPLLGQIKDILAKVENAGDDEQKLAAVRGYWDIGRLALDYQKASALRMNDIAELIDVHRSALQKYTRFYKTWPKGYTPVYNNRIVQWSMFISVMPVHDKTAREFYLQEACLRGWDKYELIRRIKSGYYHEVRDAADKQIKNLSVKDGRLYVYAALVLKIVDGDTFDLEFDVGFKSRQEHRVRLRGINCPEMSTPAGVQARDFVVNELNQCLIKLPSTTDDLPARPLVVVRSFKQGMYGRYIVDIYYLPGETDREVIAKKGKLLNQVLLDKGLACEA